MSTRQHRRSAFTLIELVASALLTALMMSVIMGVIWSSVRESNRLRHNAVSRFPVTQLTDRFRTDFQNSRGMAIDGSGITLHGFLARNAVTGQPLLAPARVRYEIRNLSGRRVLTRATTGGRTNPIWVGCAALQIEPLLVADEGSELLADPETGGLPAIPASFRVTMLSDDNRVLWREVIHHHAI
jgi:type II secretory pathway pseudopilin PulG